MNSSQAEKRVLEREAVEWFLGHYNAIGPKRYRLLKQQERPDALLEAEDGSKLGLEITHLYYDHLEARMLLGRSTEEGQYGEETLAKAVDKLNWLINKKFKVGRTFAKPYPIALLIRSASPIFSGPDFKRIKDKIKTPSGIYSEVWLLACDEQIPGWPHLICLR